MADVIKFPEACINDISGVGVYFQELSLDNGHDLVLSQLASMSPPLSNGELQLYESMRDPAGAKEIIESIEPLMHGSAPEGFYVVSLTSEPIEEATKIEPVGLVSFLHTDERLVKRGESVSVLGRLSVGGRDTNKRRLSAWIPTDDSRWKTLAAEVTFDLAVDVADEFGIDELTVVRKRKASDATPVIAEDMLSAFSLHKLGFEKTDPADDVTALSGQEVFVRKSNK